MKKMKRIISMILVCTLVLSTFVINVGAAEEIPADVTYMDVRDENALELYGLYMDKETGLFPRMDLEVAGDISSGVLAHAKESAGGRIRFKTNSSYVVIKAELPTYIKHSSSGTDTAMGAGKYGFDVYVDTENGSTYAGTIAPDEEDVPTTNQTWSYEGIYDFGTAAERNITIYFPILQEVSDVYVGVQEGATVAEHAIPYEEKAPIVYYGSSITQGASATKPGLTYVNTIGRTLNRDYINLGMFGNCKAETEFANYIAGLDMSIFVYDHDHNWNTAADLKKGHEALFKIVRKAHPDIPVIFISRPSKTAEWEAQREVIKQTYNNAIANGDKNVYFIDGQTFFNGNKNNKTNDYLVADNVHPTDKGQAAMAETIGNVLQGIIDGKKTDDSYWFTDDFSYSTADLATIGWGNPQNYDVNSKLSVSQHVNNAYMYLEGSTALQWSDYVVEVDVVMTNDVNDEKYLTTAAGRGAGIVAAVDEIPSTNASDTARGFEFMLMYDDRSTASLEKYCMLKSRNGTTTSVATQKEFDFELGKTYTMKMVLKDKTIRCYIDNELIFGPITVEDDLTGTIGVHGMINVCEFDNVRVRSSEAEPWFKEEFNYADNTDVTTVGWTNKNQTSITESKLKVGAGTSRNSATVYTYLDDFAMANTVTNYSVEADIKMTEESITGSTGTPLCAIIVGASESATTTKAGYQFIISSNGSVTWKDFNGTEADEFSTITKNGLGFKKGTTYNVKAVVNGKTIKLYVNDTLIVEDTYKKEKNNPFTGRIGFRAGVNVVEVDNIRICSTETERPHFNEEFDYADNADVTTVGWTNKNQTSITESKLKVGAGTSRNSATVYTYLNGFPIADTMTNYLVEADIKMTEESITGSTGTPLCAIIVGASESATTTKAGYQFIISSNGSVTWKDFNGTEADEFSTITKNGLGLKKGTTYNVKTVVNDKTIKLYVDNKLIVEHTYMTEDTNPFAGLIGFRAGVNVVEVDNISIRPVAQFDDNYYNVAYYRNGLAELSHPYKEGYVFAGWYADAAYTTPYSKTTTTGYAYAKFVDENVLSVKAQLDGNTKAASDKEKTRMRFVTTVDCLDYDKVGFVVSTPNKTATFKSSTVYETLNATGLVVPYTPEDISSDSEYFATIILGNLSATTADLDKVFTVTPFWVTADGTTVTGITRDADNNPITIQNGIDANNNSSSSPYGLR